MKVWYRNHIGDARECRISILDHGIGDGLWVWYGRDFAQVNALLEISATTEQAQAIFGGNWRRLLNP